MQPRFIIHSTLGFNHSGYRLHGQNEPHRFWKRMNPWAP